MFSRWPDTKLRCSGPGRPAVATGDAAGGSDPVRHTEGDEHDGDGDGGKHQAGCGYNARFPTNHHDHPATTGHDRTSDQDDGGRGANCARLGTFVILAACGGKRSERSVTASCEYFLRDRHNRAGVHPSAQIGPDLDIAHKLPVHGLGKQAIKFFNIFVF